MILIKYMLLTNVSWCSSTERNREVLNLQGAIYDYQLLPFFPCRHIFTQLCARRYKILLMSPAYRYQMKKLSNPSDSLADRQNAGDMLESHPRCYLKYYINVTYQTFCFI